MFVNPYAAIPSMHCAFALMIGATGALVSRHTIPRVLWCVYPLFVFFVVDRHRQPLLGGRRDRLDGRRASRPSGRCSSLACARRHGLGDSARHRLTGRAVGGIRSSSDRFAVTPSRRWSPRASELAYLILAPSSADHAAQVFRSGLFESEGLSAWNNLWFGGHHTPGYSVLFPFLGIADRPPRASASSR